MKRTIAVLTAVLAFAGVSGAQIPKQLGKPKKTTICHRTSSSSRPYLKIRVTAKELKGHLRHPADIIPAPAAGCPRQAVTPNSGGTELKTTLAGANEIPGPGDTDGAGTASFRTTAGLGQICYTLKVDKIKLPATGAHIHKGAVGIAGPIVVGLKPPNASGSSSGCVTVPRTLVNAILNGPLDYYANVHTTDFPAGAIRGQLSS
jgi:hypothetical protein